MAKRNIHPGKYTESSVKFGQLADDRNEARVADYELHAVPKLSLGHALRPPFLYLI